MTRSTIHRTAIYHYAAVLALCVGTFPVAICAQTLPDAPADSPLPPGSVIPAGATTPPVKTIIKGDSEDEKRSQRGVHEENEEDESMVRRRLEYFEKRHKLSSDEVKAGHAQLRLSGLNDIRQHKPVTRALPQLEPKAKVSTAPQIGPPSDSQALSVAPAGQIFGTQWIELGPNVVYNGQPASGARCKVGGRVSCAAFDPSDSTYQTLYLGTADGGVWKTTNNGTSWTPLTDSQPSLAIGCLTVNPGAPNEIYAGTGENTLSGDALSGSGILVSTNSGSTWVARQSSTLGSTHIGRIALDNATTTGATRHLLAATMVGLYSTTDAFQSVTLVASGKFCDVIQDRTNPQVWWATRIDNGSSALYKSANNGASFSAQSTGIPTNLPGGLATIVQAPSNPGIMYAAFNGTAAFDKLNLYKSTNGGATWSQIDGSYNASANSGQFFYNVYLAVNPVNANEIYVSGSIPLYHSTNGGSTFTDVADNHSLHPDHHFGLFRPDGARYYDGNDGGFFYTDNAGASDWISLNTGLRILQVNEEGIALHPTRFEILAGTQDNGTCHYLGTNLWNLVNFGDGGFTIWDASDANYVYNGYVNSTLYRSTTGGADWDDMTPNSLTFPASSYSFPFYPKAALNPSNPNMLVLGGDSLLRNTSCRSAATWQDVTGKLDGTSQISAIAFAPSDANTCYIGFNNGRVYRSGNISAVNPTWSLIMSHPNGSWCSDLAVYPSDPNHLVVAFYRFSGNQVYDISNAGASPITTGRSTGFPLIAPNCLAIDSSNPAVWYVGTEVGVYRTTTAGTSWQNYSTGLPNVAVDDLRLDNSRSILVAGTHGRGAWMVAKPDVRLASVAIHDNGFNGNGNGHIDQNEQIALTINLANFGSQDATGVTAHLDAVSGGAAVVQNTSAYPALPQDATPQANSTNFVISTASTITPGQKLTFALTYPCIHW